MRVVDLKHEPEFISQYVQLRNRYKELLITQPVEEEQTKEWFAHANIEIIGIVEDDILQGVLIIYLARKNELAFFVNEPSKGLGSQLLDLAEGVAKKSGLNSMWAWVWEGNAIAQRAFEKKGFVKKGMEGREYQGAIRKGFKYIKSFALSGKEG